MTVSRFASSLLLLVMAAACGPLESSDKDETFKIEVKCNDVVIVDEEFSSREACEAFIEDEGPFQCNGLEVPVSC